MRPSHDSAFRNRDETTRVDWEGEWVGWTVA